MNIAFLGRTAVRHSLEVVSCKRVRVKKHNHAAIAVGRRVRIHLVITIISPYLTTYVHVILSGIHV